MSNDATSARSQGRQIDALGDAVLPKRRDGIRRSCTAPHRDDDERTTDRCEMKEQRCRALVQLVSIVDENDEGVPAVVGADRVSDASEHLQSAHCAVVIRRHVCGERTERNPSHRTGGSGAHHPCSSPSSTAVTNSAARRDLPTPAAPAMTTPFTSSCAYSDSSRSSSSRARRDPRYATAAGAGSRSARPWQTDASPNDVDTSPRPRSARLRSGQRHADLAGDHHSLDLTRALSDLEDLGVAVVTRARPSRP